jgi:ribosomal protein L32
LRLRAVEVRARAAAVCWLKTGILAFGYMEDEMSGIIDCPRCGADMVLPERVCLNCLTSENTRLAAAYERVKSLLALWEETGACDPWGSVRRTAALRRALEG